ncbi:helix-hairpin-helix domain-containing protein [Mycoplasmopsis alligatoris]|uniref:S1 RNA binding domain protein n=1 Tax=Mycoplasmopsis alligatoris A21JP2 TaxID=747682 RepID=D4XVU0_9BACT|nr:Tex-like N-terminal domain-containing protein [Mycoplasmopsis alligatoris]EFF41527.1 S1 RNA binding domain protein [Mycoplasmopsis alligatoris A21JP2]
MNKALNFVASELNISQNRIKKTLDLLQEGNTIPFISRYRKEVTEGLDEETIYQIDVMYTYFGELIKRQEAIIEILKERKLLTEDLEKKILATTKKADLEAIYEPFKLGKKTKATDAIALGLEELAKQIFTNTDIKFNPYSFAQKFLSDKVTSVEFAIENALYIVSQWISQDTEVRNFIRNQYLNFGRIETKLKDETLDEKSNFKLYYQFKNLVNKVQNYQILAINRAVNLKIVTLKIDINDKLVKHNLSNMFFKNKRTASLINQAIDDSLTRLIKPSLERETFTMLFTRAEEKSIDLFSQNLESMLMTPAVKNKVVLAIDPAYINGCKTALLDKNGDVLNIDIIYPNGKNARPDIAQSIIKKILDKYFVDMIVIGNGTASQETTQFIKRVLQKFNLHIPVEVVSEIGASVYSASDVAIKEFPDLSVEQRSAINIGRKFQDPLNEIVKIDPKSIGIGQYQHDLNQKDLGNALDFKVDKVVNLVGVNLNTATKEILTHISGLSSKIADNILEYRKENNEFKNRLELKKVKGLGPKSFEQAVGFLRIFNSNNFLDKTNIHPENYSLANKIIAEYDYDVEKNVFNKEPKVDQLINDYKSDKYTIELILESLKNPTRDIRDNKKGFKIDLDLKDINDLKVNETYEGRILNITDFGIFIFIGIKDSVFVHKSKYNNQEVLLGKDVKVKILNIDKDNKRIGGELI